MGSTPAVAQLDLRRFGGPCEKYEELSVNRNTATETQTIKLGRGGFGLVRDIMAGRVGKPAGNPRKTTNNSENQQKSRDPAPT